MSEILNASGPTPSPVIIYYSLYLTNFSFFIIMEADFFYTNILRKVFDFSIKMTETGKKKLIIFVCIYLFVFEHKQYTCMNYIALPYINYFELRLFLKLKFNVK